LSRIEYDSVLEKVHGRTVWKSVERLIPILQKKLEPAEATGSFEIVCRDAGRHRLRVTDVTSGTATQIEFEETHGVSEVQSVSLRRPERLTIVPDRDLYASGGIARLLVKSPVTGTMLLTLETDHVLDSRIIPMATNTTQVELPLPGSLRGGAYVTATV